MRERPIMSASTHGAATSVALHSEPECRSLGACSSFAAQ